MARDDRLYARLTLDFGDSPKIAPLSDTAFRRYIEAVLWSRRLLTDGHVPTGMARRLFDDASLAELTTNDPLRPSLVAVDGGYQIHDFLEHQTSRAEIELMREHKREAGRKGGKARAARLQSSSSGVAAATGSLGVSSSRTPSKIKPESETSKEHVQGKPALDLSDDFDSWWAVYPRRQGKADAQKAYALARRTTDAKTLLAGAQAYALLNVGVEKAFLKMPAGWLRGERWKDERIPAADTPMRPVVTLPTAPIECPLHPGYPIDRANPCAACERATLPAGNEF